MQLRDQPVSDTNVRQSIRIPSSDLYEAERMRRDIERLKREADTAAYDLDRLKRSATQGASGYGIYR